jgi:hypothetical protein
MCSSMLSCDYNFSLLIRFWRSDRFCPNLTNPSCDRFWWRSEGYGEACWCA